MAVAGTARARAPWLYEGPARDLILACKLRGVRAAAGPLGDAIAECLGEEARVVTWVPGRAADIRARGFDHAEAIARVVARCCRAPAVPLLRRVGSAPDQTRLSRVARLRNLDHVFAAAGSPSEVVLVDDLITTGATMTACAEALRGAGAASIVAVAACRA